MAITNFSELSASLANWLSRDDLTARIPEFIALAEARLRRKLIDPDQDTLTTITITDGVGTLPADFGGIRALEQGLDQSCITYAIIDGEIRTNPPMTGSVALVYRKDIPALSVSNTTNWLLTRAPDAYLFASLIQAEFYGWNDERLPLIKAALDEIIQELAIDGERRRYGSVPLSPKIGRSGRASLGSIAADDDPGDLRDYL